MLYILSDVPLLSQDVPSKTVHHVDEFSLLDVLPGSIFTLLLSYHLRANYY